MIPLKSIEKFSQICAYAFIHVGTLLWLKWDVALEGIECDLVFINFDKGLDFFHAGLCVLHRLWINPAYPLYVASQQVDHKRLQLIVHVMCSRNYVGSYCFCRNIYCTSAECATYWTRWYFLWWSLDHGLIHVYSKEWLVAEDLAFDTKLCAKVLHYLERFITIPLDAFIYCDCN